MNINKIPAPQIIPVSFPMDDIRLSAAYMTQIQARRLLTGYWRAQVSRISNATATRGMDHPLLSFFSGGFKRIERQMKRAMEIYIDQHVAGRWAIGNPGIGPIISASLLAFIDLDVCEENVQKIWRYAGLDPTSIWISYANLDPNIAASKLLLGKELTSEHIKWLANLYNKNLISLTKLATKYGKGEITWQSLRSALAVRPWNANLKEVCYYIGRGIRLKNNQPDFLYGALYRQRKEYEYEQNANLKYEEQALKIYRETQWIDRSPESVCNKYKNGILPGFHIDLRARKWVVKLFLVHFHQVLYYDKYKKMPRKPYILEVGSGKGEIVCPNWPFKN